MLGHNIMYLFFKFVNLKTCNFITTYGRSSLIITNIKINILLYHIFD